MNLCFHFSSPTCIFSVHSFHLEISVCSNPRSCNTHNVYLYFNHTQHHRHLNLWTTIYSNISSQWKSHHWTRHRWTKPHYFSWPSTPCLRQQPHENKNRSTCHLQHTQISFNSSTIAANSTGTYIILYSIELIAFSSKYTLFNCNFNLVYRYYLSVNLTLSITG
jgi:hypothetical protein